MSGLTGGHPPSAAAVAALARWCAAARQTAQQPPAQPRLPLVVAGQAVGSVAQGFLDQIGPMSRWNHAFLLQKIEHSGSEAWSLEATPAQATAALNALADALRAQGLCGPWRNEQLAVCNAQGERVATVERGATRVLGITTRAVHLVGWAPGGRMWVQLRAQSKAQNPGLWDTLMGGMVSAADSLDQALARETWEEAGLQLADLQQLHHGGAVDFSRLSSEGGGAGFMRERIDWFGAELPAGLQPSNQDGEVERFELWPLDRVCEEVAQGRFTLEAGLVIADCLGL